MTFKGPGSKRSVGAGYLLGIGNPLLDISIECDQAFLDKHVAKKDQTLAILADEKQRGIYKEIIETYGDAVKYIAGGATQNSIRVAQWLMQSEGATSFIGSVGNDDYAKTLTEACVDGGVTPHYYQTSEDSTGLCAVLVTEKERTLVTDLAAANLYSKDHTIKDSVKKVIEKAQVYYISSFFLTPDLNIETCQIVASGAAADNKIFTMNLSAPFLMQVPPFLERIKLMIPYLDFVFGNETEAETLVSVMGWDCSIEEAAVRLSAMEKKNGNRARVVVFTQGKDETIVAHSGTVTKYEVPVLKNEYLVDSNGAGDAFVGGFLARLCQGFDIHECVRTGHYAARVVIQQSGCIVPGQPDI